ncbi:MAG: sodium-transporting two-sector ATPase [Candidatus Saccharimonadales bacterium]
MFDKYFQELIDKGQPTGKVVAVNDPLIRVRGLAPVGINALVLFDNGMRGLVREVAQGEVIILSLGSQQISLGSIAVQENEHLTVGVGKSLLGRVISPLIRVLDGGKPINVETYNPVFRDAPPLSNRQTLDEQLETGVTIVDTLFPIVLGQRIAFLGDSKTGKTSLLMQTIESQVKTGRVVVYVMIAKRPGEIREAIERLRKSGALKHTVVVATSAFDSLAESFLAPYAACAIAEHFWYNGTDTIILYDDLAAHAQVHREISLLADANPGRESYPGDVFYRHSSLLERAGKLASNSKTLTAIPAVLAPGNDVTAYLPTNIISITDGQIIFDTKVFREGMRPAISTGLSVSRVGGRAQTPHQKNIATRVFQILNNYQDAKEFARFASEMAIDAQNNLVLGDRIHEAFRQSNFDLYSLAVQQLILDVALQADLKQKLNMADLKQWALKQNLELDLPQKDSTAYNELVQQAISRHIGQG